eukprot:386905-Pleurochrysis_carterae.AAC.1
MNEACYRNQHSRQDEHHGFKTHPMAYSTDWQHCAHHIGTRFVSAICIPDIVLLASELRRYRQLLQRGRIG